MENCNKRWVKKLITCQCGDPAHQLIISWYEGPDDEDDCIYVSMHLNKLPFWKRLKVVIKYLFGKQSIYGAFDEVIIPVSDWDIFQCMVDHMQEVDYKLRKEL